MVRVEGWGVVGGPSHLLRVCGACRTRESHANAAPSCRISINAKRTSSQTFEFKRVATKITQQQGRF